LLATRTTLAALGRDRRVKPELYMAAIATLLAGLGGAMIGARAVSRSQTRAFRRREVATANALLQNLARIQTELAALIADERISPDEFSPYSGIHPWVQPLIVDLAAREPMLFAGLMALEPMLADHFKASNSVWGWDKELRSTEVNVLRLTHFAERRGNAAAAVAQPPDLVRAKEELASQRALRLQASKTWTDMDVKLRRHIAELTDHLRVIAREGES
jgi:hypothetical protein